MGNAESNSNQDPKVVRRGHDAHRDERMKEQCTTTTMKHKKETRYGSTNIISSSSSSMDDSSSPELQTIEKLKTEIKTLSERCACLEAQNVLVSVQVLDMLARGMAWTCSLLSYVLYCKLLFWSMNKIMPFWQDWLLTATTSNGGANTDATVLPFLHTDLLWMLLKVMLCFIPYLYNKWTYGSIHRRFEVFCIAFIIIFRVRACRWRERFFMMTTTEDENSTNNNKYGQNMYHDAIWEANYEISARFLYVSIIRLKGLWTKTAQYVSSRADFMPSSYIRELSKCQDEAPATEWKDIERMIPKKVRNRIINIDPIPLASASIGQVHVGYLLVDDDNDKKNPSTTKTKKVVIKVQHPHAQTLIGDDFWSLKVLARILSWMEPDYAFFENLMREWAKEAQKELDFRIEVTNLWDAKKSISTLFSKDQDVVYTTTDTPTPFQVEIPTPYNDLCNKSVLVMEFCEGTRIDNFEQLDKWGLDRTDVIHAVSQTFAHQMYVTNIFNGDPHPGNLFIRKGIKTPKKKVNDNKAAFTLILLDWGLAKRLKDDKRLSFCQLTYAASTFDYGLLLDSFKTIGLRIKKENVGESMEGVRFVLRDMAPRDIARRRIKTKIKTDQSRYASRSKKDRIPMEGKSYPGEYFFFIRVNELIHGLGSKFNVDVNYLDVLKPYAQEGLLRHYCYDSKPTDGVASQAKSTVVKSKDQVLHEKLETVLKQMQDEEEDSNSTIAGAQVCVLNKQGDVLVNVTGGHLGGLKQHVKMTDDALILGYSCTKATAATIAHIMVQEGYLSYDEPICQRVWPAFCPTENPPPDLFKSITDGGNDDGDISSEEVLEQRWQWKRSITLRHILTHQAGLWFALPANMTIKSMASCEECVASFEYNPEYPANTILPNRKPGEAVEYHFMSFGWLVAGTVMGAYALRQQNKSKDKVTYEEVYKAILEPKLSEETKRLGFRPCGGIGEDQNPVALTVTKDISASRILQMRRESIAMGEGEGDEESKEKAQMYKDVYKNFKGKEFLLDPRVWNCEEALVANVPAAGGRFTARALASFYRDLGSGKVLDTKTLEMVSSVTGGVERSSAGSALQGATSTMAAATRNDGGADNDMVQMGYGYQLIRLEEDDNNKDSPPAAFGHAGVGGSIGLYHKTSGLAMALMLNKADGGKDQTMRIMRVVAEHFDLGKC